MIRYAAWYASHWAIEPRQEALIRVYAELLEEMDAGQLPELRALAALDPPGSRATSKVSLSNACRDSQEWDKEPMIDIL